MGLPALGCTFLLAHGLRRAAGEGVALAFLGGALALGAALAPARRTRATGWAVVAGALAALPGILEPLPALPAPRARAVPVAVRGTVAAPPRAVAGGLLVPLHGRPPLLVPAPPPGPLPGSRVAAVARLEAHGRFLRVPASEAFHLAPPPRLHPAARVEALRRLVRRRLERGLAPRTAARLRTLLLGDRALPVEDRDRLGRTGTLHLFAVSGLHLTVVITLLRRGLGRRSRVTIPLMFLYAALAGLRSPVSRALLMGLSDLVADRAGRSPRPVAHLLLAMSVLVAVDPSALGSAGFVLSCSAYAGILLLARPILEARRGDPLRRLEDAFAPPGLRRRLLDALLVSLAAFVASAPATLLLFQRLPWTAVLGSVVLAPLVPPLLALGTLLVILPGWSPAVLAAELLLAALDAVVHVLDGTGPLVAARPAPATPAVIAFVVGLALVALRLRDPRWARRFRWPLLALWPLLLLVPRPVPEGFALLDAGRGGALLATASGAAVLIDAGPPGARVDQALLARGLRRVDRLLLSHGDDDHVGGLPRLRAEGLVEADAIRGAAGMRWPRGLAPREVARGARLATGPVGLEVLWPPPGPSGGRRTANDGSLALVVTLRGERLLFTGDLESRGLEALLRAGQVPGAEWLVLPHHGARNDALVPLILECRPREAWISARAGFPDPDALLVVRWLGLPARATWRSGAIAAQPGDG